VNNQPSLIYILDRSNYLVFANIVSIEVDLEVVHKLKKIKQGPSPARDETPV